MENMTLDEIRSAKSDLEIQIHHAAATMELGSALRDAYERLKQLQSTCPHSEGEFDYSNEKVCPICGKKFTRK